MGARFGLCSPVRGKSDVAGIIGPPADNALTVAEFQMQSYKPHQPPFLFT